VIFNERHLLRVMSSYVDYCQHTRTHLSLAKDCPDSRPIQYRQRPEESSPFQKSVACIIATNVSPPDSSRTPAHQSFARIATTSSEDYASEGFFDLDQGTSSRLCFKSQPII
jgi:hypothetical protein